MVNSRRKGADFEYKIARLLEEYTGKKWVRTPGSGAVATKTGNMALAGDLMPVNWKCPYVIECKKYKKVTDKLIEKWLKQLKREKGKRLGILIYAENYQRDPTVHIEQEDGTYKIGPASKLLKEVMEVFKC